MPSVVPDVRTNSLIDQRHAAGVPGGRKSAQPDRRAADGQVAADDRDVRPDQGQRPTVAASINGFVRGQEVRGRGHAADRRRRTDRERGLCLRHQVADRRDQGQGHRPARGLRRAHRHVVQDYQLQVKNAKVEEVADTINKYFTDAGGFAGLGRALPALRRRTARSRSSPIPPRGSCISPPARRTAS